MTLQLSGRQNSRQRPCCGFDRHARCSSPAQTPNTICEKGALGRCRNGMSPPTNFNSPSFVAAFRLRKSRGSTLSCEVPNVDAIENLGPSEQRNAFEDPGM